MRTKPVTTEIDHHMIRLLVGLVALLIAGIANLLSGAPPIDSISQSYHRTDIARDMFVGLLFVIFALLISYNGETWLEWGLSKAAAFSALGVALFPCACEGIQTSLISKIHYGSAAVMFIILAVFCYLFILRAKDKEFAQAKSRIIIYTLCCLAILTSVFLIGVNALQDGQLAKDYIPRLVYKFEAAALIAFGIAWLTASRTLPVITNKDERITVSPFSERQNLE